MPGSFGSFIHDLAEREHSAAADLAAKQLEHWQKIRLAQASRASLAIFAGPEITFGHRLDGIHAAQSNIPLLEQLILTPKLYVGLHAESEVDLIGRYGVTAEQLDRLIANGFVVPDLFEYESQSESNFLGYESEAPYLLSLFEKWYAVARISPIRREYALQTVGIDRNRNREFIDYYRKDFLRRVSQSVDLDQTKRLVGNPDIEWTLPHHLARLRSLVEAENAKAEAKELIHQVETEPPSSSDELADLYTATIFQTIDSLYGVQYFGAVQRWYKHHLDLFSDPLNLLEDKVAKIRADAQALLKRQNFAEFLGTLARIRDTEFSDRQEPRFDVYPLPISEFEEMLSLLQNVRNNSLILERLIADMETVRIADGESQQSSYFEVLERVVAEIRLSQLRDEVKKQILNRLLAWTVSTTMAMPWLNSLYTSIANKAAALAGSLTPAAHGLLFQPRQMKKYPTKPIAADTKLRIVGNIESLTGKSVLL